MHCDVAKYGIFPQFGLGGSMEPVTALVITICGLIADGELSCATHSLRRAISRRERACGRHQQEAAIAVQSSSWRRLRSSHETQHIRQLPTTFPLVRQIDPHAPRPDNCHIPSSLTRCLCYRLSCYLCQGSYGICLSVCLSVC